MKSTTIKIRTNSFKGGPGIKHIKGRVHDYGIAYDQLMGRVQPHIPTYVNVKQWLIAHAIRHDPNLLEHSGALLRNLQNKAVPKVYADVLGAVTNELEANGFARMEAYQAGYEHRAPKLRGKPSKERPHGIGGSFGAGKDCRAINVGDF